jgi:hypothetical protein
MQGLFDQARDEDYATVAAEAREIAGRHSDEATDRELAEMATQVGRLRKQLDAVVAIDFFGANGRLAAQGLVEGLEAALQGGDAMTSPEPTPAPGLLANRTWVTRKGVQVDRIASAWLIRRFIDPDAEFRFIDPKEERRPDELRFDMVGGDFTHEGDGCTFETLVRRLGSPDPALRHVAEIVHDIDIKDRKFGRTDAPGIQQVILGLVLDSAGDEERLRRGFALFDTLYASFRSRNSVSREVSP